MTLANVIASGDGVAASTLVGGPVRIRVLRSEVIRTGVSSKTNRPYTLSRLTATLTNVGQTPITGELHTFDGFDGAEYSVTIEPFGISANDPNVGTFTVKKVRSADDVRASRKAARDKLVGASPVEPFNGVPEPLRNDVVQIMAEERIATLENRVIALEQRLELALSLFSPPASEGA
jgi:hypothetical protein